MKGLTVCACVSFTPSSSPPASLYESLVVNEYISDLEGPSLLPEDPAQRAHGRLIIDQVQ